MSAASSEAEKTRTVGPAGSFGEVAGCETSPICFSHYPPGSKMPPGLSLAENAEAERTASGLIPPGDAAGWRLITQQAEKEIAPPLGGKPHLPRTERS